MIRFFPFKSLYILLFSLLVFPSYAKTPQEARNELAQMKITYSENGFLYCAGEGKTDVVKLFLDAGMNPNVQDSDGWTALLKAEDNNHLETVKVLLANGADEKLKTKFGFTFLMAAAARGDTERVKALLAKGAEINAKNNKGYTALMEAVEKGRTETVKFLLAKGADVNVKNLDGKTALTLGASKENEYTNIIKFLKNAGEKE